MAEGILSATIIGFDDLARRMDQAGEFAKEELKKAMDRTAILTESKAREKAPHLRGALRNSIHAESAQVTRNNVTAKVGTNLVYARAQEYGTVGMVIHATSRKGLKYSYIGNIQPKNYMRDAKLEVLPLLTENISKAVKRIISRVAG
jgi:HK97 gp10 family phage protein